MVQERVNRPSLLFDERYVKFLASAHPQLMLRMTKDGLPYYFGRISCLDALTRGPRLLGSFLPKTLSSPRSLVLGLPFEPYQQTLMLDAITDLGLVRKMAREVGADLVMLTNQDPNLSGFKKMLDMGFFSVPSFPDMVLHSSANTFDDYLAGLKRRHRHRIREQVRKFSAAGHVIRRVSTITSSCARAIHEAYCEMYRHARVPWFRYEKGYFAGFLDQIDGGIVKLAQRANGEIIGMVMGIEDQSRLHVTRVGVRGDFHRRDGVLFRLLYAAIEYAIEANCSSVSLGPTAYRIKRRMGATLHRTANLILPTSTVWKILLNSVGDFLPSIMLRHLSNEKILESRY